MLVEIWSDLVCPWCYIGKRRFEAALETFSHGDEVEIMHRSFQLDPEASKSEVFTQLDMLTAKYGLTVEQVVRMQADVERTAASEGLEYHLQGGITGNTFDAHRLVHLAQDRGVQDAVVERFFRAHFTEQRSLYEVDSLVALAIDAGLGADDVRVVLSGGQYAEAVRADEARAAALGATGVPFFVIGGRYAVSGAQPADSFAEALDRAWQDDELARQASRQ